MNQEMMGSYLAVLHDPYGLLRGEKRQMREVHSLAIGEVYQPPHLRLLILQQCFIAHGHDPAHVLVRVFVRVEYAWEVESTHFIIMLKKSSNLYLFQHQQLILMSN